MKIISDLLELYVHIQNDYHGCSAERKQDYLNHSVLWPFNFWNKWMVLIPGGVASRVSDDLLGYAQLTSVDKYQHLKRNFYLHPQGTSDISAMLVSIYRTAKFETHTAMTTTFSLLCSPWNRCFRFLPPPIMTCHRAAISWL